jgi:acetyl esterase/lipase
MSPLLRGLLALGLLLDTSLAVAARYLDPVFESVDATLDVPYRDTVDYRGTPVRLHLDVYEPAGDPSARRPAIVWMHGGYFIFGDKRDMADYADEFARRGYVSISLQYRLRTGLSPFDPIGIALAGFDAHVDAVAAVAWLRAHADEYRIDPDTIAAAGYSAGAVTALNLAYLPGQRGPATSPVAAAVSIAGLTFGIPEAGEPPALVLHGTADATVPFMQGETACLGARTAGVHCDLVPYRRAGHDIVTEYQSDIVRRTAAFLAEWMLVPRGVIACTITGTEGADELEGTIGDDVICGLAGNDVVRARGGNDQVYGGPGDDRLRGDAGADVLGGGEGRDRVLGGRGRDQCSAEVVKSCNEASRGGRR